MELKTIILDGYVDEPSCLGVPPYISPYPRYVAGALYSCGEREVSYFTIDEIRKKRDKFLKLASKADLVVFIGGTVVPGKYLAGSPATLEELVSIANLLDKPLKVIGGPAVKFGTASEGGKVGVRVEDYAGSFDAVVEGDLEAYIPQLLKEGLENADSNAKINRENLGGIPAAGAQIVKQHPLYPFIMVEIETYRGCPRYVVGGCSFCTTPLYGKPQFRSLDSIIKEIETLHNCGVKFFRIGCQADLLTYKADKVGDEEFPKPNVEAIKKLYSGVKKVAPTLEVLHMDNVNPGTIVHWRKESIEILKIIVEYGTSGDVAAFGVESFDEDVVKRNNLKVFPDEALEAIKVVNNIGKRRGWNGLPSLLPGVNILHGLMGETKKTFRENYTYLKRILDEGLLLRRINIRQVMVFKGTRMEKFGLKNVYRHKRLFRYWRGRIRTEIDIPMLKKVVPEGTRLRNVFTEKIVDHYTWARQFGTYPLLVKVPIPLKLRIFLDVVVSKHRHRSVKAVPYEIEVNSADKSVLKLIPGFNKTIVLEIMKMRPFKSLEEFRGLLEKHGIKEFKVNFKVEPEMKNKHGG